MGENTHKAYDAWREESQKFDYFMLGLIGAICAYVAQNLRPERLGLSPFTLEVVALGLLVAAAVFGFRRLEANVTLLRQTHGRIEFEEQLSQLVANYRGDSLITNLGEVLTPDRIERRVELLRQAVSEAENHQKESAERSAGCYRRRNWALLAGFAILVAARISQPYL